MIADIDTTTRKQPTTSAIRKRCSTDALIRTTYTDEHLVRTSAAQSGVGPQPLQAQRRRRLIARVLLVLDDSTAGTPSRAITNICGRGAKQHAARVAWKGCAPWFVSISADVLDRLVHDNAPEARRSTLSHSAARGSQRPNLGPSSASGGKQPLDEGVDGSLEEQSEWVGVRRGTSASAPETQ